MKVHRLLRKCTVQSTERAKIFVEKFFALEVGLGREELQGILVFAEILKKNFLEGTKQKSSQILKKKSTKVRG